MSLSSIELAAVTDLNKLKAEYTALAAKAYSLKQVSVIALIALAVGYVAGKVL